MVGETNRDLGQSSERNARRRGAQVPSRRASTERAWTSAETQFSAPLVCTFGVPICAWHRERGSIFSRDDRHARARVLIGRFSLSASVPFSFPPFLPVRNATRYPARAGPSLCGAASRLWETRNDHDSDYAEFRHEADSKERTLLRSPRSNLTLRSWRNITNVEDGDVRAGGGIVRIECCFAYGKKLNIAES